MSEKKTDLRYWTCSIGPYPFHKLDHPSDPPMRNAVKRAYVDLTGEAFTTCESGWGDTEIPSDRIAELEAENECLRNLVNAWEDRQSSSVAFGDKPMVTFNQEKWQRILDARKALAELDQETDHE